MLKQATESSLSKINRLLGITDSYKAPARIMDILLSDERDAVFDKFLLEYHGDLSFDWFHEYFEDEHADRKNNKQDFTPTSLADLTFAMLSATDGVLFEPSAGTGGMLIRAWHKHRIKFMPWDYDPSNLWIVAEELSNKTIPFLLFNLSIRGINGNVLHVNSLTRECSAVYLLENNRAGINFSEVIELPQNKLCARCFNLIFKAEREE